jgi:hypothetical protein
MPSRVRRPFMAASGPRDLGAMWHPLAWLRRANLAQTGV